MSVSQGQLSQYWPGWLSGLVLGILIVAYFWVTGRMLASSGRITQLIDRWRHGGTADELPASAEELAAAMRLATTEAFGATAIQERSMQPQLVAWRPPSAITWLGHLAFLVGLGLGGRLANPGAPLRWSLGSGVWDGFVSNEGLPLLLLFAGVLVGFGTRMAGGCTIGHGLCGMSRGQSGSWASGLAFFAAGVMLWLAVAGR
jgi:uncharacterized protein